MILDDILKKEIAYFRKYDVDPDILFLSQKSYTDLLKQAPNTRTFIEMNQALTEQKIFGLRIIILNGNGLDDYFSVRHSSSLADGRTRMFHYRVPLITNSNATLIHQPDFSDVVIEEIPQFEIDAYLSCAREV